MDMRTLRVGGYEPFSATEYPGKLAAVVFIQGCPWRCGYCHNPHLQPRTRESTLSWPTLLEGLKKRVGLLDAVVFCGGEPTIDPALDGAIGQVKELGFQVGLETAGIYPDRLRKLLPLLDWVGIDVKAPFGRYHEVTGAAGSGEPVRASLRLLLESGIDYECRTTVHADQLPPPMLRELAHSLAEMGVQRYVLQEFRTIGCQDMKLNTSRRPGYPDAALVEELSSLFMRFSVRRND